MGYFEFLVVVPIPLGPSPAEGLVLGQWLDAVVHVARQRWQLRPWRHSVQNKFTLVHSEKHEINTYLRRRGRLGHEDWRQVCHSPRVGWHPCAKASWGIGMWPTGSGMAFHIKIPYCFIPVVFDKILAVLNTMLPHFWCEIGNRFSPQVHCPCWIVGLHI